MFDLRALRQAHDKLLAEAEAMLEGVLYDAGNVAIAEVALHPGFMPRTGALQKATNAKVVRSRGGAIVRVTNTKRYAPPIEFGARPHKIVATRARALRFYTANGIVFRKSVNHPGNRPYRFMSNAIRVAGDVAGRRLLSGMQSIARIRY